MMLEEIKTIVQAREVDIKKLCKHTCNTIRERHNLLQEVEENNKWINKVKKQISVYRIHILLNLYFPITLKKTSEKKKGLDRRRKVKLSYEYP